jgi:hypothetical protein
MSDKWEGGKGDCYRKVDRKKYDLGYLMIFGKKCKHCNGKGCELCDYLGYVEKEK